MKGCVLSLLIKIITTIIIVGCLGWLVISYINVIANNLEAIPRYADWNLFTIIFG